jgi:hypothetical protein
MAAKRTSLSDPALSIGLARVQPALAAWRERRRHREAIPENLWRLIVPLARAHGVSPVARALRLNYTALASRSVGMAGSAPALAGNPADGFVEVAVPAWPGGVSCSIELEDHRGAKMTVRLACAEAANLLAVAQGLWRQRS